MYGDDGPDDDYMTTDQALDSGWLDPDSVDVLRNILKTVDITKPTPGDRAMAALILLNMHLNPQPPLEGQAIHPHITWAQTLLDIDD